jgi:protoporphyrinogen oxidase
MNNTSKTALVIGAGPAGLCAADELSRTGRAVSVLERDTSVGGLSRTLQFQGYRFDIGAHRFFSKNEEIRQWWNDRLGSDLLEIRRLTRILYRGKYFYYPLRLSNVLRQLGLLESLRCMLSYAKAVLRPVQPEHSFEDWVKNRFGDRLFQIFFKAYTEKVWGMPCTAISADWAAQRIRDLSFSRAVAESLGLRPKKQVIKTLAENFSFPRLGCGMMWERTRDELQQRGVVFHMGHQAVAVLRKENRITAVRAVDVDGRSGDYAADDYIFSMPLGELALAIEPPLPETALCAARRLKYRHLLLVLLIVDRENLFPDHWIYIHDPRVTVGRIANFRNWSIDMVPDTKRSGIALDYFCSDTDALWKRTDEELLVQARSEMEMLQLAPAEAVLDGCVVRVPQAYPVFDAEYRSDILAIKEALQPISNLHIAGRNGMHKYNNQDHSMLTGIMAARAANGEAVDPWKVNIDAVYLESGEPSDSSRLLPSPSSPVASSEPSAVASSSAADESSETLTTEKRCGRRRGKNFFGFLGLALTVMLYLIGIWLRYQFIFLHNRPTDPANIFGDIEWYVFESLHYFEAGYSPTLYDTLFPPGMAIYIAAMRWFDPSLQALLVSQWLLACLIPLILACIADRLFGSKNALLVWAFASLYFPLWEYFGYLFSEGPFLFSLSSAFLLLLLSLQARSEEAAAAWGICGGLFLGAAAACKSVALFSAGLSFSVLIYYRLRRRFQLRLTAVAALLGLAAVLAPLSIHATRFNEGRFLLIANDASRTFLLGHQGRAGLTWWVDSQRNFHMNFINPSTIQHNYTEVKTYPFGVYESGPNYAAGWQWIRENPLDAVLLSFEHIFDMFAVALPYPGFFRPYARWVSFFNEVFLMFILFPAALHVLRSGRRIVAADPAYAGDAMLTAAVASIFIIAFLFLGEGRYRICYDGFMLLLASRALLREQTECCFFENVMRTESGRRSDDS